MGPLSASPKRYTIPLECVKVYNVNILRACKMGLWRRISSSAESSAYKVRVWWTDCLATIETKLCLFTESTLVSDQTHRYSNVILCSIYYKPYFVLYTPSSMPETCSVADEIVDMSWFFYLQFFWFCLCFDIITCLLE